MIYPLRVIFKDTNVIVFNQSKSCCRVINYYAVKSAISSNEFWSNRKRVSIANKGKDNVLFKCKFNLFSSRNVTTNKGKDTHGVFQLDVSFKKISLYVSSLKYASQKKCS